MFFSRILFHYEAFEAGGGAVEAVSVEAGADPSPDAAPGADAGVPAAEPSAEAAASAWADTPEFRQAVAETAAEVAAERMQSMFDQYDQQGNQPDPEGLPLDPLSDDFGSQLTGMLEQMLDAKLAPLRAQEQQQQRQEGEQRVSDILADFTSREGEFLVPDLATQTAKDLSGMFYQQEVARYGEGPRAAEAAILKAAQLVKNLETKAGEAAVAKNVNHLSTLAGAPEPGLAGGGIGTEVRPAYKDELEAARAFSARSRSV